MCNSPKPTCYECEEPSVRRFTGESDSFGTEHYHLCEEHSAVEFKRLETYRNTERNCDWCGTVAVLSSFTDYDDGGSKHSICPKCRSEQNRREDEELEFLRNYWR